MTIRKMKGLALFAKWREAMGLNGNEVRKAAAMIGVNRPASASDLHSGNRAPSETQRLAMSAVRAGLPPWSPEVDAEIASVSGFPRPK